MGALQPPDESLMPSKKLRQAGIGPAEIARRLSISRASVYRIIGAQMAV